MSVVTIGVAIAVFLLFLIVLKGVYVLREFERGVLLRLGRYDGLRGPGITWVIPFVDELVRPGERFTRAASWIHEVSALPSYAEMKAWTPRNESVNHAASRVTVTSLTNEGSSVKAKVASTAPVAPSKTWPVPVGPPATHSRLRASTSMPVKGPPPSTRSDPWPVRRSPRQMPCSDSEPA